MSEELFIKCKCKLSLFSSQRVTGGFAGGLKRLTSVGSSVGSGNGSKVKKEEVKVEYSNLPQQIVEQSTLNHVAIVRDVVESHYKNRSEK